MSRRQVALAAIVEFMRNGTTATQNLEGRGYPVTRIETISNGRIDLNRIRHVELNVGEVKKWGMDPGDILLSHINSVEHIGKSAIFNGETPVLIHGMNLLLLRPNKQVVSPNFLAYALKTEKFRALVRSKCKQAVNQASINQKELGSISVLLPSLPEQFRLADLLSHAEGIVCLRREAQRKAAELVPALFLDMFGDPTSNPKGWPSADFGTLGQLDRGKSRHRPRDAQELYGGPYPFIQTGDVTNSGGHITRFTQTYSELGLAQSRLWPAGTLCITIAANIARTGVLDFDACFPDSVVGFTPSQDVTIEYIQHWLGFLQPTLERNAPQAAQKNINLEILRNLPVPVPPIELQRQFAAKADAVRGIAAQQTAALATAQATFDALLHQSFAGS